MKILQKAKAIFDRTITVLMGLSAVLIVVLALSVTIDVLKRASLGTTWPALFELTEYSLVWIVFLGATWLLKEEGHIRMVLVISRLNPRRRAIINIVTSIVCALLLAFITWQSAKATVQDYQTGFILANLLRPPKWPIEMIIPIGSFLLFIQFLIKACEHVTSWKVATRGEETQLGSTAGGEH